jgi:hypothetical protein
MLFSWRVAAQDAGTDTSGTWQLLVTLDFATVAQDAGPFNASRASIWDVVRLKYRITTPHSEPQTLLLASTWGGIFPFMSLPGDIPDPFEQVRLALLSLLRRISELPLQNTASSKDAAK